MGMTTFEAIGSYEYKGFELFGKNDYKKVWEVEAVFILEEFGNTPDTIDWMINNRIYDDSLTTLAKTKKYLRENEEVIKTELRIKFKQDFKL